MPSKADLAPSITAFDPSSVVTSPRTNFASPPTLRISSVAAAARPGLLPLMTTLTPSPARTRAHCAPIPEVLPVTSARFPLTTYPCLLPFRNDDWIRGSNRHRRVALHR